MSRRIWLGGLLASALAAAGTWGGWQAARTTPRGAECPCPECCPCPDCCPPDCCPGGSAREAATPTAGEARPAGATPGCCPAGCCPGG